MSAFGRPSCSFFYPFFVTVPPKKSVTSDKSSKGGKDKGKASTAPPPGNAGVRDSASGNIPKTSALTSEDVAVKLNFPGAQDVSRR